MAAGVAVGVEVDGGRAAASSKICPGTATHSTRERSDLLSCALAGSLWSLRLGLGVYAFHVTNQLERPGYTVVRQLSGGVELRAYPEYVVTYRE